MSMNIEISLSSHAKSRIKERALKDALHVFAEVAYEEGEKLSDEQMKELFYYHWAKETQKKRVLDREYRLFRGFVFVYRSRTVIGERTLYTLITVFPEKEKQFTK